MSEQLGSIPRTETEASDFNLTERKRLLCLQSYNDLLRVTQFGGEIEVSHDLKRLGKRFLEGVFRKLRSYQDFQDHEDHSKGAFEHHGETIHWSIKCWDRDFITESEDPCNLLLTCRVLTLSLQLPTL